MVKWLLSCFVLLAATTVFGVTTPDSDKVTVEENKYLLAKEQWVKQKTLFYIDDLNVTRSQLATIEASTDKCDKEIQKIVKLVEDGKISDDDYLSRIAQSLSQHEKEVGEVLGTERLAEVKKFRAEFNETVWDRFGANVRFTGF